MGGHFGVKSSARKWIEDSLGKKIRLKNPPLFKCVTVRFSVYRYRFIDLDNVWGSVVKICMDAMKNVGLFPDDKPEYVSVVVQQFKISKEEKERIEVEFRSPPALEDYRHFVKACQRTMKGV